MLLLFSPPKKIEKGRNVWVFSTDMDFEVFTSFPEKNVDSRVDIISGKYKKRCWGPRGPQVDRLISFDIFTVKMLQKPAKICFECNLVYFSPLYS